jgi:hypothetical protein
MCLYGLAQTPDELELVVLDEVSSSSSSHEETTSEIDRMSERSFRVMFLFIGSGFQFHNSSERTREA